MKQRHDNSRRGFTLIEMIATIAVLGAISAAASSVILAAADGYLDASTRAQLHTESSIALDRIVREMRNVQIDGGAASLAADLENVAADGLEWNGTHSLDLNGTTLEFDDGGGAVPLLEDVDAFIVEAFDEDNDPMVSPLLTGAACDPIRRLRFTITLDRFGTTETLRTKVFLRCTMEGAE
jgi:prepilin-type N-terminal cleavage/methylation domain-containing protein